jgi:hypothetical protein
VAGIVVVGEVGRHAGVLEGGLQLVGGGTRHGRVGGSDVGEDRALDVPQLDADVVHHGIEGDGARDVGLGARRPQRQPAAVGEPDEADLLAPRDLVAEHERHGTLERRADRGMRARALRMLEVGRHRHETLPRQPVADGADVVVDVPAFLQHDDPATRFVVGKREIARARALVGRELDVGHQAAGRRAGGPESGRRDRGIGQANTIAALRAL